MTKDPIIEEVRRIRHSIETECGDNEDEFYQHILESQKKYKGHLVRRNKKMRDARKTA